MLPPHLAAWCLDTALFLGLLGAFLLAGAACPDGPPPPSDSATPGSPAGPGASWGGAA